MLARLLLPLLAAVPQAQSLDHHRPAQATGLHLAAWFEGGPRIGVDDQATLHVRAADSQGKKLDLRLLNPPPGLAFPSLTGVRRVDLELPWFVPATWAGRRHLEFEASTATTTKRLRLTVDIDGQWEHNGLVSGDITGDGILDLIATRKGLGAPTGGLFVWKGGDSSSAPAALLLEQSAGVSGVILEDLDRDGILDVLCGTSTGFPYETDVFSVWLGGPSLTGTRVPDARLIPAVAGTELLGDPGWDLRFYDLTGDGLDEIVVRGDTAISIWDGSSSFSGLMTPDATLLPSVPFAGDLGLLSSPYHVADVTGDGRLDIISGTRLATIGGQPNIGALFVWAGRENLQGTITESALLTHPNPTGLPSPGSLGDYLIAEVTGDGVPDVIARWVSLYPHGYLSGVLFVWEGGPMAGSPTPKYHLAPEATEGHSLTNGLRATDLTGDGVSDIVATSYRVESDVDVGSIHIWHGRALVQSSLDPHATLLAPASSQARLGTFSDLPIVFRDFDGDGHTDVLAASHEATVDSVFQAGAIYFWNGGPGLSGTLLPTATLKGPAPRSGDRLTNLSGRSMLFADVTGDEIPDLVSGSYLVNGTDTRLDTGRLYVWAGGAPLAGLVPPTANLKLPNEKPNDQLGLARRLGLFGGGPGMGGQRRGVHLADVTGDGVSDVIGISLHADRAGVQDVGAISIWAGGSGLVGKQNSTALLLGEGNPSDFLGEMSGHSIRFVDLDEDGNLDIVSGTALVDRPGLTDVGAYYQWFGGPSLAGDTPPDSILEQTAPGDQDQLGYTSGEGIRFFDFTGDGVPDFVGASAFAGTGTSGRSGAAFIWNGASPCQPICPPLHTLLPPTWSELTWFPGGV